ncbi:NUDIX domain-containing protein [Streptomyces sp. NPDC048473]|uniref:NUDIX domain-containing protein n=1 Tax=unclassified Streptomyces TaxID=2593676 RepID=UPI003723B9B9
MVWFREHRRRGLIIHDADGRILLVQPSYGDGTWEIVGGGLDRGEHPRQAARREAKMEQRYHHQIVGTDGRMSDVSAAIARNQLRRLPSLTDRRRVNAARLSSTSPTCRG